MSFTIFSQEIDAGLVEEIEVDFAYFDVPTIMGPMMFSEIRAIVTYRNGMPVFKSLWRVASGDQPYIVWLQNSEQPFAKAVCDLLSKWLTSPAGRAMVNALWDDAEEKRSRD